MRDHKYRVWSAKDKKMIHFTLWHVLFNYCDEDGFARLSTTDLYQFIKGLEGETEVMECTGLHDKNGKEGYAGDIVKMFDRSLFCIVWNEYYARFQLDLVRGDEHVKVHDMGMLQFSEIVGNVHENPELVGESAK